MLPSPLDLSLAVLHCGQSSLIDRYQAVDEDNRYAMAFRYGTSHTQEWRAFGKQDLDTSMAGGLHMLWRTLLILFSKDVVDVRYIAWARTLSHLYYRQVQNLERPLTNSTYRDHGKITLEAL